MRHNLPRKVLIVIIIKSYNNKDNDHYIAPVSVNKKTRTVQKDEAMLGVEMKRLYKCTGD